MQNRTWEALENGYRFGFGGQERDDQVSGAGNSYTAEYWQYDSRLGRRFNTDPVIIASYSAYACFANSPLILIDPNGADTSVAANKSGNIVIWIGTENDEINYEKHMGQDTWDLIATKTLSDAYNLLQKYKEEHGVEIENVIIRGHSVGEGTIRTASSVGGMYYNKITGNEVETYRETVHAGSSDDTEYLQALTNIAGIMEENGSLVITACRAGVSTEEGDLGTQLAGLLLVDNRNNINLYLNSDQSTYYSNDNGKFTKWDANFTASDGEKYGWTRYFITDGEIEKMPNLRLKASTYARGGHRLISYSGIMYYETTYIWDSEWWEKDNK